MQTTKLNYFSFQEKQNLLTQALKNPNYTMENIQLTVLTHFGRVKANADA